MQRNLIFTERHAVLWIMIKTSKPPTFVAGQLWILPFLEKLNLEIKQQQKTKYKVSEKPEDCGRNITRKSQLVYKLMCR